MELKRLTGKEDMDVVFCCMALESNSEVADAIHNVAQGSSANQFIAEFIKCVSLASGTLIVYVGFNVYRCTPFLSSCRLISSMCFKSRTKLQMCVRGLAHV